MAQRSCFASSTWRSILGRMLIISIRALGLSLPAQVCLSIVAQQHPGQARVGSVLLPLSLVASEHTVRSHKRPGSRSLPFSRRTADQGEVAEKQSQFAFVATIQKRQATARSQSGPVYTNSGAGILCSACQAYQYELKNSRPLFTRTFRFADLGRASCTCPAPHQGRPFCRVCCPRG